MHADPSPTPPWKRNLVSASVGLLLAMSACVSGERADEHPAGSGEAARATEAQPRGIRPGLNPLQREMVLLDNAMREVITALSYNALAAIPDQFHPVHAARDSTVAFLGRGVYRTPRNPDAMAEFEREDAAFHEELEAMVTAAADGDLQGATRRAGAVLDACTGCHLRFRFEPVVSGQAVERVPR